MRTKNSSSSLPHPQYLFDIPSTCQSKTTCNRKLSIKKCNYREIKNWNETFLASRQLCHQVMWILMILESNLPFQTIPVEILSNFHLLLVHILTVNIWDELKILNVIFASKKEVSSRRWCFLKVDISPHIGKLQKENHLYKSQTFIISFVAGLF